MSGERAVEIQNIIYSSIERNTGPVHLFGLLVRAWNGGEKKMEAPTPSSRPTRRRHTHTNPRFRIAYNVMLNDTHFPLLRQAR